MGSASHSSPWNQSPIVRDVLCSQSDVLSSLSFVGQVLLEINHGGALPVVSERNLGVVRDAC